MSGLDTHTHMYISSIYRHIRMLTVPAVAANGHMTCC